MGVYGFIIFWTQKGQFQGEHRGGVQRPPPNRIFLTPRQLGLNVKYLVLIIDDRKSKDSQL